MARKSVVNEPPQSLSHQQKLAAISRLEARLNELRNLDVSQVDEGDHPIVTDLAQRIDSTLASIYGQGSPGYNRLSSASNIDATIYQISWDGRSTPPHEVREGLDRGRKRAISILQGEVDSLKEDIQFSGTPSREHTAEPTLSTKSVSNAVFIVHGRDDATKTEVARLIERAGLEAIILHEQPNGGRTIIQKFEDHGRAVGFAVVVMTPDDVGGLDPGSLHPRARQNVIGEMFWFAGRLGRERVCALKKGNVELPTDFAGVGYIEMDASGAWKKDVLRELQHAGFSDLDWPKALA